MQTRVMVEMNGISLHALDPRIIVQGVTEAAPSWNVTAQSRALRYGQLYTGTEKRFRDVTIKFAIACKRDLGERERILQSVAGWAMNGGKLRLSYRQGQQLNVICAALPAVDAIEQWANPYQITFRAYEIPEWMDVNPRVVSVSAQTGEVTLSMNANAGGKLEFTASNTGTSTCNTLTVSANGQSFSFSGLDLTSGSALNVSYNGQDIPVIRIGNSSALAKRSAASDDDIWLNHGPNTITYSAGVELAWDFRSYGRWCG